MIIGFRSGAHRYLRPTRSVAILMLAPIASSLAGCGNATKPVIEPIEFTSNSGASAPAVTSLPVNGQIYLVGTVKNDNQLLGVSWTVACGSAEPPGSGSIDASCGTFVPTQTESGPVPAYPSTGFIATYNAPPAVPKGSAVTITAHVTSLPSVSSSITLTIVAARAGDSAMAPSDGSMGGGQSAEMRGPATGDDADDPGALKDLR